MSNKKHRKNVKPHEDEVDRLLEVTESRTIGELGQKLGYASGNAITNWKSDGLNYKRILEHFPNINVNYLKSGEGPKRNDKYEKAFNHLKDRTSDEDIPYNARDLLLEALVSEAEKIQNDLQDLTDNIRKLKNLDS